MCEFYIEYTRLINKPSRPSSADFSTAFFHLKSSTRAWPASSPSLPPLTQKFAARIIDLVAPLTAILPEVQAPPKDPKTGKPKVRRARIHSTRRRVPSSPRPPRRTPLSAPQVDLSDKLFWTAMALLMYLVASQVPLYGMKTQSSSDAFYIMRMILASQKGTLMELGISPIITSGMIMQLLIGAGIIECKLENAADRVLYNAAGKILVRRARAAAPRTAHDPHRTPLPRPFTRRAC